MKPITFIAGMGAAALLGAGAVLLIVPDPEPPAPVAVDTDSWETGDIDTSAMRKGNYNDDYAALNAKRDGVVILPSGVQYEILEDGKGRPPTPNDSVLIEYTGSLANGSIFDSTEGEAIPVSLAPGTIAVAGLHEALMLMSEGAHWRVVVPPDQGFGRTRGMHRKRDLIYDVRLVAIEPPGNSHDQG